MHSRAHIGHNIEYRTKRGIVVTRYVCARMDAVVKFRQSKAQDLLAFQRAQGSPTKARCWGIPGVKSACDMLMEGGYFNPVVANTPSPTPLIQDHAESILAMSFGGDNYIEGNLHHFGFALGDVDTTLESRVCITPTGSIEVDFPVPFRNTMEVVRVYLITLADFVCDSLIEYPEEGLIPDEALSFTGRGFFCEGILQLHIGWNPCDYILHITRTRDYDGIDVV